MKTHKLLRRLRRVGDDLAALRNIIFSLTTSRKWFNV